MLKLIRLTLTLCLLLQWPSGQAANLIAKTIENELSDSVITTKTDR